MKIGLVTLFRYNFGSALQCYSTQKYLRNNYCDCIVIEKSSNGKIWTYINTLMSLCYRCLTNPCSIKHLISRLKVERSTGLKLSSASLLEIERFITCYISTQKYGYKELRSVAQTDEFNYFFVGSDQVWNGAGVLGHDMFFLRFAPLLKRIAWAPSFGSNQIEEYNQKIYTKYISQFQTLSVREKSGNDIIKRLLKKDVNILCDPVILFTGNQWRDHYNGRTCFNNEEKYICLFFIDPVSEKALQFIKQISEEMGLGTLSFGYNYDSYNALNNHIHYDGSPFDFLKCIDCAETIITDSFHATVFSVLFQKDFYTFTRNYAHNQDQSTRLTDLLESINAIQRFNPLEKVSPMDFSVSEAYFKTERQKMDFYLEKVLKCKKSSTDKKIELFGTPSECCGCGACVDICPFNAIVLSKLDRGYLPIIDNNVCVQCGKCIKVCGLKNSIENVDTITKKAYFGKGENANRISKSASGGIFATIAQDFLKTGGVVYGASIIVNDGICECRHIRVDRIEDLHLIQNSKYVQSNTDGIFREVDIDLQQGRSVLFSGTSCQVASLKTYLKGKEIDNLYTIDLICHGVPSINVLQNYVDYIQRKENAKVVGMQFRNKDKKISKFAPYIMTFELKSEKGIRTKYIPLRKSSFYRLFMNMAAYRYSCYKCEYASINKPADITLGDYYLDESKSLNVKGLKLDKKEYYSSILCHTKKGLSLLTGSHLNLYEMSIEDAILSHANLQHPSLPTHEGNKLMEIYAEKGFDGLQKYIDRRNRLADCVKNARALFVHLRKN